ncbi:MAG: glucose-6-phosphate isomerase [Clostridiaceae bacterium]|nr:glucose-6-phosphate isomerase [Clostridiaceae bacterium]
MEKICFHYPEHGSFISEHEIIYYSSFVKEAHAMLHEKKGAGSDFLGWVDWPLNYDRNEFKLIKDAAEKIKSDSKALVVIGIGGSYLGARAVIEALSHSFYNQLDYPARKTPGVYFAGHNISPKYLLDLMEILSDREISVIVASKSGTTTEPAITFRIFREYMEKRYGKKEAARRIYAVTDNEKGTMKRMAEEKGYVTFDIPHDIGGRYSVLTALGLLPIAVAGVDIDALMEGAAEACKEYSSACLQENQCYMYAVARNILCKKGKIIEIMVNYEPSLHYFTEWWKQLYGESEGKDQKGIFPAGVDFTTDLHSMGQYIQDGMRNLFETVLNIKNPSKDIAIKEEEKDIDELNYLAGKTMDFVNKKAMEGTIMAHADGGVPNLVIDIPMLNAYYLGSAIYFFEKACGISGYLQGVNPFDQPGVEAYKKNMFALLGKPGYKLDK